MNPREKVIVTGNVICTEVGSKIVSLQGKTGSVLTRTHSGSIAVLLIDGLRYHIPVGMLRTVSQGDEGNCYG